MNREILFRGQAFEGGNWYYGDVGKTSEGGTFISTEHSRIHIIPETCGQYTGLADKNGKRIFEGDILKFRSGIYSVEWDNEHSKFLQRDGQFSRELHIWIAESEIVGNIHDNPELLKGEEDD